MGALKDFNSCKPKSFDGRGGTVELNRWFEKMEYTFALCDCPASSQVKFAASTFTDAALSWWTANVKVMTLPVANALPWADLKARMIAEYCPRSETQRLETELWELKMKGSDLQGYTHRFTDLAVICPRMVTPEHKKIERYIHGLVPEIQGNVISSGPTTFESAKAIADLLTGHAILNGSLTKTTESSQGDDHKRKLSGHRKWDPHHNSNKRQNTAAAYAVTPLQTIAPTSQRQYRGTLPRCEKCNYHHNGACRELL